MNANISNDISSDNCEDFLTEILDLDISSIVNGIDTKTLDSWLEEAFGEGGSSVQTIENKDDFVVASVAPDKRKPIAKNEQKLIPCHICGKMYTSEKSLKAHYKTKRHLKKWDEVARKYYRNNNCGLIVKKIK